MNKVISIFLLAILLFSGVFAVKQVEPYSQIISNDNLVGRAVPNSTLELVFSKENEKFDTLKINNNFPEGFSIAIKHELESFKVLVNIPDETNKESYKINLTFSNSMDSSVEETVEVYFLVDSGLLFASMDNFSQETFTGQAAEYSFTLINNSDAKTYFIVNSSLPSSWHGAFAVQVLPKSIVKEKDYVVPGISGERKFVFTVDYGGDEKEFNATIKANPTIESKFSSTLNGLPFYSFSLIPNYLLNGLFALLF
jgi:hypothetical protein